MHGKENKTALKIEIPKNCNLTEVEIDKPMFPINKEFF